jgi:hypothetical protein
MNQQELDEAVAAKLQAQLAALPPGPSARDVATAVDALAKAIEDMPDGPSPQNYRVAAMWRQAGRYQINRWTGDLRRSLDGVVAGIAQVKATPLPPAVVDAIEMALWRLDTGREKIKTIACLTLGVPVVTLNRGRTNVDFKVDVKTLEAKLTALAVNVPAAGRLNTVLEGLSRHDATELRNEVTHELSQVVDVPPLFYFQLAWVRQRQIQSWETRYYFSNSAPFNAGNLAPSAVLKQTFVTIVDAFDTELQAVKLLAEVVQAAGRLEPWDCVFVDLGTGVATRTDPRTVGPSDPWPPVKG